MSQIPWQFVCAVWPTYQRHFRYNCCKVERLIKVRKEGAASRRLPSQVLAEPTHVDGDQQEVILVRKMPLQSPRDLIGGRQVDEAVARIIAGAE